MNNLVYLVLVAKLISVINSHVARGIDVKNGYPNRTNQMKYDNTCTRKLLDVNYELYTSS